MANLLLNPTPGTDPDWMTKFNNDNTQLALGGWGMLFLGDSITSHWLTADRGLPVWASYYAPRAALNLGIGGDRVENVLWRIEHYNFAMVTPHAVVLLVGTNNVRAGDNPTDIAEAVTYAATRLRQRLPGTPVVLLAITPRENKPYKQWRYKANEASARFAWVGWDPAGPGGVYYRDPGRVWLDDKGCPLPAIYADPEYIHPSTLGYQLLAAQLEPIISDLVP